MTIRYADSFGAYAAIADVQKAGYVSSSIAGFALQANSGRRSGRALRATFAAAGTFIQFPVPGTAPATLAVAVAARISDITQVPDNQGALIVFGDDTVIHVGVSVLADGSVRVFRGIGGSATTLGTSSTGLVTPNTYFHLEVQVTIDNGAGAVKVYLDGSSSPIIDLSAQDTNNGGTSTITRVGLGADRSNSEIYDFCDLVIRDGTTQLGDVRVDYLPVNSNGAQDDLATNGSSNSFENVDELNPNDLDYNYSSTPGAMDLYGLTDVDWAPSSIFAVVEKVRARKSDNGTRSLVQVARSGAVTSTASAKTLSTDSAYFHNVRETDPNTSAAWLEAGVNALQVGVEVA